MKRSSKSYDLVELEQNCRDSDSKKLRISTDSNDSDVSFQFSDSFNRSICLIEVENSRKKYENDISTNIRKTTIDNRTPSTFSNSFENCIKISLLTI